MPSRVLIDLITDVTALLKPSQDQIAKITKLSWNIKIGFSVSQVVLVQDQPVLKREKLAEHVL